MRQVRVLAAVIVALAASCAAGPLPWVEDDYARARQQALERKLPLFVEAWAPW